MGWRERDWARFSEQERRILWDTSPRSVSGRGSAATRATAAAIAVSLVLFALGNLPRAHPLIPALHFTLPSGVASALPGFPRSHRQLQLRLPPTVPVAASLTLAGSASGQRGLIDVEQSFDGGSTWTPLGSTTIGSDGRYRLSVRFTVRGQVRVQLRYPNGDTAVGTTNVA